MTLFFFALIHEVSKFRNWIMPVRKETLEKRHCFFDMKTTALQIFDEFI